MAFFKRFYTFSTFFLRDDSRDTKLVNNQIIFIILIWIVKKKIQKIVYFSKIKITKFLSPAKYTTISLLCKSSVSYNLHPQETTKKKRRDPNDVMIISFQVGVNKVEELIGGCVHVLLHFLTPHTRSRERKQKMGSRQYSSLLYILLHRRRVGRRIAVLRSFFFFCSAEIDTHYRGQREEGYFCCFSFFLFFPADNLTLIIQKLKKSGIQEKYLMYIRDNILSD